MKGAVEHVRVDHVTGWALDLSHPEAASPIRVLLDKAVIAQELATTERPDVARALSFQKAVCGFRIAIDVKQDDLDKLVVQASANGSWQDVARLKSQPAPVSYQDFDGDGGSKSHKKLEALKLFDLNAGRPSSAPPLEGKSVLDIGCNEGFFCAEALRQGASRVLGIDADKGWIEKAKRRVPSAEFRTASWWDIPNEKFDVILFLSAIHYEPNQKSLLDKLASHLTDSGVLILECGVKGPPGKAQWNLVQRWDGMKRYPSLDLLRDELLSSYAVRWIGPSVNQDGDPVPRFVFHCRLRKSVAMVITGVSHSGKTALATELRRRGIPHYDSDTAICHLLMYDDCEGMPLTQKLIDRFGKGRPEDLALVGKYICESGLEPDLASFIAKEVPSEAGLFMIEGEVFRHKTMQEALFSELSKVGVRAWLVERGNL